MILCRGGGTDTTKKCHPKEKMFARAQWLRGRVKQAADPKAAALEAGAAFAEAAAAVVHQYQPQRSKARAFKINDKDARAASALEDDARVLFQLATQPSNPRVVLRRAMNIAAMKEIHRRRELMRPEKRRKEERRARRLHARELAAERRRQRSRRAAAHLALFRDGLRSKGYAGFAATRAVEPNTVVSTFGAIIASERPQAAALHARNYLALFCLTDEDVRV